MEHSLEHRVELLFTKNTVSETFQFLGKARWRAFDRTHTHTRARGEIASCRLLREFFRGFLLDFFMKFFASTASRFLPATSSATSYALAGQ